MTLDRVDRINETAAAIRAVAALLGAADGVSDETRAEVCALIVRMSADVAALADQSAPGSRIQKAQPPAGCAMTRG